MDESGFYRAIIDEPDDDTHRLVFADWLDENGRPDFAEFIRVQVELEPMRDRYEIPRASELHAREQALEACEVEQTAPVLALFSDEPWALQAVVRRGFLESVRLLASDFLEHGAALRETGRSLRRVRLYSANGKMAALAASSSLRDFPEIELACWYTPEDARKFATESRLPRLESLIVWLGGKESAGAINDEVLVRLFASAPAWPGLKELVLFDPGVGGGVELAALADAAAGRRIARVIPPPDGRLPFAESFCYFCPGVLPGGRRVVIKPIKHTIHVLVFGDDHRVSDSYHLQQPDGLKELVRKRVLSIDDDWREALHSAVGSEPAFIRVFPFEWPDGWSNPRPGPECHKGRWNLLGCPDQQDEAGLEGTFGNGGEIAWIVEDGQYGCDGSWADNSGNVHST